MNWQPPATQATSKPATKEQLRLELLRRIVKNEAQRRRQSKPDAT